MEYYKKPLIDMSNSLKMLWEEKKYEIEEALTNVSKTNAFSLLQNRLNDIDNFRKSIDKITPTLKFEGEAEYKKEYERIKSLILEINLA